MNDVRFHRHSVLFLAAVAITLAGCESAPTKEQEPAGVEDRTAAKPPAPPASQASPVQQQPIARVDLTGKPAAGAKDPRLTDPKNILSRRSVFYDLDQYDVKEQYRELVAAHAKFLRENPGYKMLVQGNTDERGSREYNLALGQKRSENLKKMLVLLGAREDQVEAVSLGEEKPRAEGANEDAWSQNRRSDILYTGEF